jgi:adenylylsulfate kinase-like enzyme
VGGPISNRGRVIWIAGLSGAGKSSLCQALAQRLRNRGDHVVRLDGDAVRAAFGNDLGYFEADRVRQVKRVQAISRLLADQGFTVIVALLYMNSELYVWNRTHLPGYFEIYLRSDFQLLKARDTKGLYREVRDGDSGNVVGVDIPWHPPTSPDLTLDSDFVRTPEELSEVVLKNLKPSRTAPDA